MTKKILPAVAQKKEAMRLANEHRYDRKAPTEGRIAAFDQLERMLVNHAGLFETGELQNQRNAIAASILDVCKYLTARGIALPTQRPLMRVVEALAERGNSNLDPLFSERPEGRSGRPQKAMKFHQQTGVIAAFANHWLEHHRDTTRRKKDQYGEVARRLDHAGLGKINAARIKQARELVSQEGIDHPAVGMHRIVCEWLETASEEYGPKEAIGLILPIVAQMNMLWRD